MFKLLVILVVATAIGETVQKAIDAVPKIKEIDLRELAEIAYVRIFL